MGDLYLHDGKRQHELLEKLIKCINLLPTQKSDNLKKILPDKKSTTVQKILKQRIEHLVERLPYRTVFKNKKEGTPWPGKSDGRGCLAIGRNMYIFGGNGKNGALKD